MPHQNLITGTLNQRNIWLDLCMNYLTEMCIMCELFMIIFHAILKLACLIMIWFIEGWPCYFFVVDALNFGIWNSDLILFILLSLRGISLIWLYYRAQFFQLTDIFFIFRLKLIFERFKYSRIVKNSKLFLRYGV